MNGGIQMKTETPSGQTKALILKLLSSDPSKAYSWAEMRQHVDSKITITDGVFAGSIQALNHGGKMVKVDRGMYQIAALGNEPSDKLSPRILKILKDAEENIRSEVNGIEVLDIEEDDFETIRHIKKLVVDLAKLRTTFEKALPAASEL